ncbi:MAG: hypothetical protein AAFR61_02760 [Bacteroidota bacterium]
MKNWLQTWGGLFLLTALMLNQAFGQDTEVVFWGYTDKAVGQTHVVKNLRQFEDRFGQPGLPGQGYFLRHSLEFFWQNGGQAAKVISLGPIKSGAPAFGSQEVLQAIQKLPAAQTAQIWVLPDLVSLPSRVFYQLLPSILNQAENKRAFVLFDVPMRSGSLAWSAVKAFKQQLQGGTLVNGMANWPYLQNAQGHLIPASGAIAGTMVRLDGQQGVWKAPAGLELRGVHGLPIALSQPEVESLMNMPGPAVNPLRLIPVRGYCLWGSRTLAGNDNEWRYVPVRRLGLEIERVIHQTLEAHSGDLLQPSAWTSLKSQISAHLQNLYRAGAFPAATAKEAYFVRVGLGETMTQADIDAGRLKVVVGFAPLQPAEFVMVKVEP